MSDFVKEAVKINIGGVEVSVFDPPVRKVLRIGPLLVTLLPKLASEEGADESTKMGKMVDMLTDEVSFEAFKVSAAACTDQPPEFFDNITISELSDLIDAAEKAVNWESIKRLFLKMSSPMAPKVK